jgi:hypothetical protein
MVLNDFTIDLFRLAESQLKQQGKLTKPLDYGRSCIRTCCEGAAGEGELQAVT